MDGPVHVPVTPDSELRSFTAGSSRGALENFVLEPWREIDFILLEASFLFHLFHSGITTLHWSNMPEGYADSSVTLPSYFGLSIYSDTTTFSTHRTLASAVAVPEQDTIRQSPEIPTKRRQSSVSEHETKRRRLSSQGDLPPHAQRQLHSPPVPAPDRPAERRPNRQGREEDRKRGQRLFGGLLGTLSQSSTTAAQKRRADIEKRQQDKLKSQADEYDGLKKRRKERRDAIRRKEKPFYEREAVCCPCLLAPSFLALGLRRMIDNCP